MLATEGSILPGGGPEEKFDLYQDALSNDSPGRGSTSHRTIKSIFLALVFRRFIVICSVCFGIYGFNWDSTTRASILHALVRLHRALTDARSIKIPQVRSAHSSLTPT